MPSLTNTILLALAACTPFALAAPSFHTSTEPTTLAKRADYYPVTALGYADYCGEADENYKTNDNSPLIADCQQIPKDHPGYGYWLITVAETNALGSNGWVRLAQSGTCAFEVAWVFSNSNGEVVDYKFGTNDLGFYIRSYAHENNPNYPGKVEMGYSVACGTTRVPGEQGSLVFLRWRMTRA